MELGRIAVAEVHQEVGLVAAVGEKLRIHLRVVEPGHRAGVQAQGTGGDQKVGPLKGGVAEGVSSRKLLLPWRREELSEGGILRKEERNMFVEARVSRDDRTDG